MAGAAPPLRVDGAWGRLTDAAVRGFQFKHPPLRVDGIVGPRTWRTLDRYRPWSPEVTTGGAVPQSAKAPPPPAPARPAPAPLKPAEDAKPQQLTLVSVGFTDKENAKALFGATRPQFVNLDNASVLPVGTRIPSVNQLGRTPPVAIKVTPPTSTPVEVRLVREPVDGQFPAGSKTLSAREAGLDSQTWISDVQTVQTDVSGELLIAPGLQIAATAAPIPRAGGSPGQAVVAGSNTVTVKRRIYVLPIVHYAAGRSAAMSAIDAIASYLAGFDIEVVKLLSIQGDEFGVLEQKDLPKSLLSVGGEGLSSSSSASATKPHCIAVIVGEFVADDIETVTFKADISKPFKNSIRMSLARGTSQYVLVPLSNGNQVVRARVLGSQASKMAAAASEATRAGRAVGCRGAGGAAGRLARDRAARHRLVLHEHRRGSQGCAELLHRLRFHSRRPGGAGGCAAGPWAGRIRNTR